MKYNLSTNEQLVLDYLENNTEMTIRQAQIKLHINNPYDVIKRLRDYGYDIPDVDWRTNSKTGKRFGVYALK